MRIRSGTGCPTLAKLGWVFLFLLTTFPLRAQQTSQPSFTLRIENDLVLTNVVVRDKKTGAPVPGLTQNDFTVLENGKPQPIVSFDYETIDRAIPLNEATVSGKAGTLVLGKPGPSSGPNASPIPGVITGQALRNHRLIVLFFDITSMQPEDLTRSVEAAQHFIQRQMQPADLVAAVSLDSSLSVDQDFTANKQLLLRALAGYSGTQQQGYGAGATSTTNQVEDATSFTPDESEYNDLNTDRELFAIAEISRSLAPINQKKSLLYFSGGLQRDGIENQASLRAATNAAVRSNLSIYSVDTRGLEAISPLGDASTGSLRGTSAYNGAAFQNNLDSNFNTQEVLSTLATDTGGKFYGDSNDFAPAFERVEQDTSAYYVIGFRSTNPARDGRYRKLSIKLNRSDVKLEYRPGYYAPADYQHSNHEDRERQLTDQLASDLPATDVAVYLAAYYFQLGPGRYYVPISLIVPGSQIPFTKGGDKDKATLDILGQVKDASGHPVGDIRQTVKLAVDQAQQAARKNIQYSTSFTLPPGRYHLKFVVRENETGHMGSFESDITVPDLAKLPVKLSSVVLASQRAPAPKSSSKEPDPLVHDGLLWIPNVAHVFRSGGHLYLLYELYAPATNAGAPAAGATNAGAPSFAQHALLRPNESRSAKGGSVSIAKGNTAVLTSIEFLSGATRVFQTPTIEATRLTDPARNAIAFQFDIPLADLKPGLYTCQVNVIDDNAGAFSFPRAAILIR
ncbi:MAG: VWA domain-containing protein [Acidobacteriaceae bacterium]